MNGSRVRGGEGRFITFYFIIFYTISFFIYKKKYESYKSTLTNPHLWPISYNKKITGNLKNSIIFFRFTTTFPEYSIILFKTVQRMSQTRTGMNQFLGIWLSWTKSPRIIIELACWIYITSSIYFHISTTFKKICISLSHAFCSSVWWN